MSRLIDAHDLELYAIHTSQFYETHKQLASTRANGWAWIKHIRDSVLPRYCREIEPVTASADTVSMVAGELCDYYRRHMEESA